MLKHHQVRFVPMAALAMRTWDGRGRFRLSSHRLCSPHAWCRAATAQCAWWVSLRVRRGFNGRCYCPCGWQVTISLVLAGWGCHAWLSRYDGPVPCGCDEALAHLSDEREDDDRSVSELPTARS